MNPSLLIKHLREGAELTQTQVADRAKITQGYLCRVENGKYDPKLKTFIKILKVFGYKLEVRRIK